MFYHFLYPLSNYFSPFNLFQYITFRVGGAILTSLLICFIFGPPLLKFLKQFKISQTIRTDGPPTHLSKHGTPTMGGLLILVSMVISTLLWARLDNRFIVVVLISTLWLGLLGFWDDYLKLIKKDPKGLDSQVKFLGQLVLALGVSIYIWLYPSNHQYASLVNIPYLKLTFIDLYSGYILFSALIIVGSSNGVNLTDGLDGLAIGNLIIAAFTLGALAYFAGHMKIAQYLKIIPVAGAGELTVFLASLTGAGLGFLWFNSFPAQMFMGDTGSLFLGGVLGMTAIFIKQELILVVVGGVFVMEALSVILQVYSFRHRKKRIFKMAPIHHHFELSGWAEPKVTVRFWIIGIMLALLALSSLKVR
ncbi:MAG TPA: phospho-N-acetylmuramoyl-pentapeptide-transferase [Elusimicrobia bacterium]|nr:MAG: phospho-N-acetylmuramoyl-pentapeptide-transferase [Elusimicrobia bacterium RIFOXYA12_FULL_49_49]OGS15615.1 MAG: phospho-N-acetylmuramoyl-pentapeptide-transferase [Elusimicrobia bacterium RIFOXYA2_FULL_47_53]OGS26830.1 MAG: phospho-N-acetylmuramoyl-pentapeptide-transferase [Elusimicrobia bacterium RIFOXYB12_FULL_50_12]OGS30714.1 MAG: phospho-N-acetylmuramoyl-pentapeptide-transferase [Elusimicrobia bacterium RIFOXYB2_FULL_46_23]HBU68907.1 phospho-N-acetylmuramoyl-pentapeptide-transferase 